MRRIVLVTLGSLGDLHPFLAVAGALRSNGDYVTIVTHPNYKELVEKGCACSSQRRSRAGPGQSHPIDGTEFGEGEANRGSSEHHCVEPHLRELSPDAQYALCARCNGATRIGGDRVIRCNLVFGGLGHEWGREDSTIDDFTRPFGRRQ